MNKRIAKKWLKRLGLSAFDGIQAVEAGARYITRSKALHAGDGEMEAFRRNWKQLTEGMDPPARMLVLDEDMYTRPLRINQPEHEAIWLGYTMSEYEMFQFYGFDSEDEVDKLIREFMNQGTITVRKTSAPDYEVLKPFGVAKFYQQGVHYRGE